MSRIFDEKEMDITKQNVGHYATSQLNSYWLDPKLTNDEIGFIEKWVRENRNSSGKIEWKILCADMESYFGTLRSEDMIKNYWYSKPSQSSRGQDADREELPQILFNDVPVDLPSNLCKGFINIGYLNLHDVSSWWEDEKELHEEDSEEDIILFFFREKFGAVNDFMDIIKGDHFSLQTQSKLYQIYTDFLEIFDYYMPLEWISWYIHVTFESTRSPAPCPFNSGKVVLPEHIKHVHYSNKISKKIQTDELGDLEKFILNMITEKGNYEGASNLWYHGTHSIHAASIVQNIDLTLLYHFGHAFGFRRSFYVGNNLKYCLQRAIKKAESSNENCALVVFCINEEMLCSYQDHWKLSDNGWNEIVPLSRNSSSDRNNLDEDPIPSNVHWVEGPSLKKCNYGSWTQKKEETIRSFRTIESTQFLHSQLSFVITFKNPSLNFQKEK